MRLLRTKLASTAGLCALAFSSLCGAAVLTVDNSTPGAAYKTISQAANLAGAGDTVLVRPGIYRENVRLKQSGTPQAPIRFVAEKPGSVVITGADGIGPFQREKGEEPIYRLDWPYVFAIDHQNGHAIEHHPGNAPLYGRAEEVIADDRLLLPCADLNDLRAAWSDHEKRITSPVHNLGGPFAGMFFADTARHVLYLWLADGSDPKLHVMQAATRPQIFGVNEYESAAGIHDVDVSGFVFRYAANFPQRAAVVFHGKRNNLHNCIIEKMAGTGVAVAGTLSKCLIRDNGFCGGAVEGDDFLIDQCVWENNCSKPIDRGWESGGAKICDSRHGQIKRCVFRRNGGPGLWFDIDCRDISVTDCAFVENEMSGLFIEISRDISVQDNFMARNAMDMVGKLPDDGWSCGGIQIGESTGCIVQNNVVVGNRDGITLREIGPRTIKTRGEESVYHTANDRIARNNISKNHDYAVALWWDNPFFGPHPSQADQFKSPESWRKHLVEIADRVYDPGKQKLVIDENAYDPSALFLYGAPWRPEAKKGIDLKEFSTAAGFEKKGTTIGSAVNPTFSVEQRVEENAPFPAGK